MMQLGSFLPWSAYRLYLIRSKAGQLAAQSLYETLTPEEMKWRTDTYARYPEMEAELTQMQDIIRQVQLSPDALDIDLLPRLKAHLAEQHTPEAPGMHFRWSMAAAAVVSLGIGIYLGVMLLGDSSALMRETPRPMAVVAPQSENEVALTVAKACRLAGYNEVEKAVALIENAIQEHPDDPAVGEALLHLADLEYAYLQRYARAYTAYDTLREKHPRIFASSLDGIERFALLAEARRENFAPLHALNDARNHSENAFSHFERLMALYPNTALASAAMNEMLALVRNSNEGTQLDIAGQFEAVRAHCSDPVAMAQVDLTLGDLYCSTFEDRVRARNHYIRAAASDHIALSHRAQEALTRLD